MAVIRRSTPEQDGVGGSGFEKDTMVLYPRKITRRVVWDGLERTYLIHKPESYDDSSPVPAIVVLHGGGGSAEFAYRVHGWRDLSEREGCLIVFPEGTLEYPDRPPAVRENPRLWNDGSRRSQVAQRNVDDVGYLSAVVDDVRAGYHIDPQRVFVTGFSNGATMTFRAGVELADRFAAIAPVSGHLCLQDPQPARPLSMLYIIGMADPLNPFLGGSVTSPWGANRIKPPIMESIMAWVRLIEAPDEPEVLRDSDDVRVLRYGPGRFGHQVQLCTIEGQGHEWPGAERTLPSIVTGRQTKKLHATRAIWEFFVAAGNGAA